MAGSMQNGTILLKCNAHRTNGKKICKKNDLQRCFALLQNFNNIKIISKCHMLINKRYCLPVLFTYKKCK